MATTQQSLVVLIPLHYSYQLYVIMGFFSLGLLFGCLAVYVRLRDKGRRFLLKKTERSEGVYIVPHSPLLAALFIILECGLSLAVSALAYQSWHNNNAHARAALRTVAPLMPWPLWAWIWISLFGPIYAVHLFPVDVLRNAASARVARWVRFRPKTLNMACYGTPILLALPALSLSVAWSMIYNQAVADDDISQQDVGARLYQIMWIIWLLAFVLASALYALYSTLLIRILQSQLSTLAVVDNALKAARAKEDLLTTHELSKSNFTKGALSNMAIHQLSRDTNTQNETQNDSANHEKIEFAANFSLGKAQERSTSRAHSDHPEHSSIQHKGDSFSRGHIRRSSSWFFRGASKFLPHSSFTNKTGQSSLNATLKQYSKLDLLRLNTRLIIAEGVLFIFFCLAWCGFIVARVQIGLGYSSSVLLISTVLLVQLWLACIFASSAAWVFWSRGRAVPKADHDEEEQERRFKIFFQPLQKLLTPKTFNPPVLEVHLPLSDDEKALADIDSHLPPTVPFIQLPETGQQPPSAQMHSPSINAPTEQPSAASHQPTSYLATPSELDSHRIRSQLKSDWISPPEWERLAAHELKALSSQNKKTVYTHRID